MAIVNEYFCENCGFELVEDGRVFIWDDKSNQTQDFLILMSTCHLLHDAKITGDVNKTYCGNCKKHLNVYSIKEVSHDIENPCETVVEGIKNYIEEFSKEVKNLKDIKKRAKYTISKEDDYYIIDFPEFEDLYDPFEISQKKNKDEAIAEALNDFYGEINDTIERYEKFINMDYMVIDDRQTPESEELDYSKKINCPECGSKIGKYINPFNPCPICGGQFDGLNSICYD